MIVIVVGKYADIGNPDGPDVWGLIDPLVLKL